MWIFNSEISSRIISHSSRMGPHPHPHPHTYFLFSCTVTSRFAIFYFYYCSLMSASTSFWKCCSTSTIAHNNEEDLSLITKMPTNLKLKESINRRSLSMEHPQTQAVLTTRNKSVPKVTFTYQSPPATQQVSSIIPIPVPSLKSTTLRKQSISLGGSGAKKSFPVVMTSNKVESKVEMKEPEVDRYQKIKFTTLCKTVIIHSQCPFCHNVLNIIPKMQDKNQAKEGTWELGASTLLFTQCYNCQKELQLIPQNGMGFTQTSIHSKRSEYHNSRFRKSAAVSLETPVKKVQDVDFNSTNDKLGKFPEEPADQPLDAKSDGLVELKGKADGTSVSISLK